MTKSWHDGGEFYFIEGMNITLVALCLITSMLAAIGILGFDEGFIQSFGLICLPIIFIILALILDMMRWFKHDCEDCDWFNHDEGYCSIDAARTPCADFVKVK